MEEKSALADSLPTLWLVIPCYNEEDVLPITAPMFKETVASLISDGLVAKGSRSCLSTTDRAIKPGR